MNATEPRVKLSPLLRSVPVIMIFMNVGDTKTVPGWAKTVPDLKREPAPAGQPSGRKLFEGKVVDLSFVLDEIGKEGFIPVRLVVIERAQGIMTRMALVCVHEDHLKAGDRRMPRREEADIRMLLKKPWDVRVYRNPGEAGGNFIVDCGNPKAADRESLADLQVIEGQFLLVKNEDALP